MKKKILIVVVLFFSKVIIGQNSKNFVHLFSGKTIDLVDVEKIDKLFSSTYFKVNGKKVKDENVEFYKNKDGFYANIKNLNFLGSSAFAEREVEGRINLFSKEFTSSAMTMGPNGMMTGGFATNTTISYYYNKGELGRLKKTNYKNLKEDLNDNVNSMLHLNKYKSVNQRGTLLYVLGGVIATVGLATFINKTSNVPSDQVKGLGGSYAAFGIGFGTIIVNYLTTRDKHKYIEKAINVYNE